MNTSAPRSITIIGPNLRDQSKGQFVAHATGCADIARCARRDPEYLHGWAIQATTQVQVAEDIYSDIMAENADDPEWSKAEAYLSEIHFAPCCKLA
jgi:hypothetical protein